MIPRGHAAGGGSRHEEGHLLRAGQMVFTCSGHTPWSGALGVAEIITDSCQPWTQICGHSKAHKCAGRRSLPGPPHPPSPAFVLRVVSPSFPAPTSEQQERFNGGQLCFGNDKKAPCQVCPGLSFVSPPFFVRVCNGFCSKGQRRWTWIWCVPGVFLSLFSFGSS